MRAPARAWGWSRSALPSGLPRFWSASPGGGVVGDGIGEAAGFITIAAPGAVGQADIDHHTTFIVPARWCIATAPGMAATGATGRRITGRPDRSIAREPGHRSVIRLAGRGIGHPAITGHPAIIGRRMEDDRRSSRYGRAHPATGHNQDRRTQDPGHKTGLRRTGPHRKRDLRPRIDPRRKTDQLRPRTARLRACRGQQHPRGREETTSSAHDRMRLRKRGCTQDSVPTGLRHGLPSVVPSGLTESSSAACKTYKKAPTTLAG
jgi:hypothetical protein